MNFSINRSAMYLFVGCTEVALHSCFATFVRLRLSPFWNACSLVQNYTSIYSQLWIPCTLLCSRHFKINTEHVLHTNSKGETLLFKTTIDTNGKVGNITDKTFWPLRRQKYPPDTKRIGIPNFFFCWSAKKWAWHLKNIAFNTDLVQFNHLPNFIKLKLFDAHNRRAFKYTEN